MGFTNILPMFHIMQMLTKKILKHWIKDFLLPHGGCKCLGDETDGKLRLNQNRLSIALKTPRVKLGISIGFRQLRLFGPPELRVGGGSS